MRGIPRIGPLAKRRAANATPAGASQRDRAPYTCYHPCVSLPPDSPASETATTPDPTRLNAAIRAARRGFRSDVQQLVEVLGEATLLVPLARTIDDLEVGKPMTPPDEVRLVPHLLPDDDGTAFVALFTDPDVLRTVGQYLQWSTVGDETLQYCTLPAKIGLDLALQLVDGERVHGAVLNPSDEYELILSRDELGALAQGRAIPLVGYVKDIPLSADDKPLISELEQPPRPELLAALARCLDGLPGVSGHRLQQTFNAERDVEPHLTLVLEVANEQQLDTELLNERLSQHLEGQLPDPGYIDVLFDSGTNRSE